MPRNPEKNVYVTIALPRTSSTLKHLQREATDMGMSIADLIKALLADRMVALERQDKQQWAPREEMAALSSPISHEEEALAPQPMRDDDDASRRAASAASAARYWDD